MWLVPPHGLSGDPTLTRPRRSPAAFGAILQGSLFGLVGQLPGKYSAVFMSGQGLAGTFAAIAILITTASECRRSGRNSVSCGAVCRRCCF